MDNLGNILVAGLGGLAMPFGIVSFGSGYHVCIYLARATFLGRLASERSFAWREQVGWQTAPIWLGLGIVGSRFSQHGQFWVGLTHWHLSHKDNFLRTIARHGFARLGLSCTGQFARTPAWHGSISKCLFATGLTWWLSGRTSLLSTRLNQR